MPTRLSASGRASSAARVVGQRLGVGLGAADLQRDRVGIVGHVDARIIRGVGFRHLLGAVAQAHHPRRLAEDLRLGQREEIALVAPVERAGDVARELQMLLLVLADRHMGRLVEQDVGRHQHRIGVEAEPGHLAVLAGLFLELGHPVEPAERGQAAEQPAELGMGADHALVEDDAALGVDAGGDIGGRHLAGRGAQFARVLRQGQRVQVDDAEDALVIVLQLRPSCGSRRDNCRDADCRSAGCRKRCGSWGLLSPPVRTCGQAGWPRDRINRPRSSRQSVTPSARISAPNEIRPAATSPANAPSRSERRAGERRREQRSAGRRGTRPCRCVAAAIRGMLLRARRSSRKWPCRASRTSKISACIQPAADSAIATPTWARNCINTRVSTKLSRHRRDRHLDRGRRVAMGIKARRQHLDQHEGRQPHRVGGERRRGRRCLGRAEGAALEQHREDRLGQHDERRRRRQGQQAAPARRRGSASPPRRRCRRCAPGATSGGRIAVPIAMPTTPSGSWFSRSA